MRASAFLLMMLFSVPPPAKPAIPARQREELISEMGDVPPVDVRDKLDLVWERYRRLQESYAIDADLREKVEKFVDRAMEQLESLCDNPSWMKRPAIKRPYNPKKSAKWNRENASRAIRCYDSPSDIKYEKPFQLVLLRDVKLERENDLSQAQIAEGEYLILSVLGRVVLIELPFNTTWGQQATVLSLVAELQPFQGTLPGHKFDSVLKPLILRGVFRRSSGARIIYPGGATGPDMVDTKVYETNNIKAFQ